MPQEVLDLHSGGTLQHRLFFWRRTFVDIFNRGFTDFFEQVLVRSNNADRPSVNEAF